MRFERTVLLIDDDPDDLNMLEQALKSIDGNHKIIEAKDGMDGLEKLVQLKSNNILPCLIVLDINMPRMDGKQTFISIKADEALSKIPVVIFSTSSSLLDRTFFERHQTSYFVKPINFTSLVTTASRMIRHCFHTSEESK